MDRHASRDWIGLQCARFLAGVAVTGLVACSSGGDGTVGLASGQSPDPVVVDFPIAYTKGPLFDEDAELLASDDLRELERFAVGTDLYLRDFASPSSDEINVTEAVTEGLGDVMGVQISRDGNRLLFSMRGPFDPDLDDDEQPTWNIWEYDIELDTLRRIIPSNILAEEGQDISPNYLPDGRIVFSSTRQSTTRAILLDEGKPQYSGLDEDRDEFASVLHVMNDDGSNLHQISFNQSHDYSPSVLDSGEVLFSRWDRAGTVNGIHLYRAHPDGSELELYYGAESHATGTDGGEVQFIGARQMQDGRVMAILRPFVHPELGGDIVVIDTEAFAENSQPVAAFAGLPGPAQSSGTVNAVRTDLEPSTGGRFSSAFPLWDGSERVMLSWTACRVLIDDEISACAVSDLEDPALELAPPLYGIWIYDPLNETMLPIVPGEEGVFIADVVAAQPRPLPAVLPDKIAGIDIDADLAAAGLGVLNIRSVYDIDGVDTADPNTAALADPAVATAAERPARFVRILKPVSIPEDDLVDLDNTDFGPNIRRGMREIVAYAPVEPDGSVRVAVPANVPLAVTVLDANGRRISARHQNWLQLVPGEELSCNGCHNPQSGLSHGRSGSFDAAYPGAPNGLPFANTVGTLVPLVGETMAEARTRISCESDCAALDASLDVIYEDVWTDPAVRAPDAAIRYEYSGLGTAPPVTVACQTNWSANCRSVINYETHIHPLWALPRQTFDAMDNLIEDNTCASAGCHMPVDAMSMTAVPAGQLDLSDGLSPDQMDHFNSYRELLFNDNEQELVNGALQDVMIEIGMDAMGNPILVPIAIGSPMSAGGANLSGRFFNRFAPGGTHAGRLSEHELRLISEWLDIGAQYYNNPFDVPEM